jgi:hypothetical protein
MKIIFSRKGFDASYGGRASPIFSDGTFCSLPIPDAEFARHGLCYENIWAGDHNLGQVVQDLTHGKINARRQAHLDPDLVSNSIPRLPDWQPLFGQCGAAEGHLQNQGVTGGDLFLFFGWFRQVEQVRNRYRYVQGAPDLHVLFGWLQVESRLQITPATASLDWMSYHPHIQNCHYYAQNSLYLACSGLGLPALPMELPGAGTFSRFAQRLRLTAASAHTRGLWKLPGWFYPQGRPSALSYHGTPSRWQLEKDVVYLRTVGRGQEFVLDCDHYPEAIDWLVDLFQLI